MLPGRFGGSQPPASRKSRLEGKHSMLPKPVRPGSIDRLSSDRRPSSAGVRSSSADPPRVTFGGGRHSKDASAHKLPINRRSKSQQGDRGVSMTPLHSNRPRSTTTPVRTPSEDRCRSWQTCLERALAFVTIKDQRPISNVAWQRAEMSRVQQTLSVRGEGGMVVVRPLTIARFVDVVGALLADIIGDPKLNTDNYVTKLPHLAKRLLYPGTLSKSWLKTVNTLHAFPHALALVAYLLDIVLHLETPVSDEWMYAEKDELACLRRDYLQKCWIRFQEPEHQFDDLDRDYLQNMKHILAYDEEKVEQLKQAIKQYSLSLEEEAERAAASAELERRVERRDALDGAVRTERRAARRLRADLQQQRAALADCRQEMAALDAQIDRLQAESLQLDDEVSAQSMSVAERERLLRDVSYARNVADSKRALVDRLAEMAQSKETELAQWQKKTLDSCVEYNRGLIHLSAQFPELTALTVDQKELMGAECAATVAGAVETLRALLDRLAERRADLVRTKTALATKRSLQLEQLRAKVSELKRSVQREQAAVESARQCEARESEAWGREMRLLRDRTDGFRRDTDRLQALRDRAALLDEQDGAWRSKLSEMQEYIQQQQLEMPRILEREKERRVKLLSSAIKEWNQKIAAM